MRFSIAAVMLLLSPPAFSQACQSPNLLRGEALTLSRIAPALQPPKGEFETSRDYANRIAIPSLPDSLLLKLEPSAGTFQYDADQQRFTWKREVGWADVGLIRNFIPVYSDLYTALMGKWSDNDALQPGKAPRVSALAVEAKKVVAGSVGYSEWDVGAVLFEHPKSIPETLTTSTIPIEAAPKKKKVLRAVALIAPIAPYFIRQQGSNASLASGSIDRFNYTALLADVVCLGIIDDAGNLLASYGDPVAAEAAAREQRMRTDAIAAAAAEADRAQRLVAIAAELGATIRTFRDCSDCPEMVLVPDSSFVMGSPASEAGREMDESPLRRVTVPAFAVGKYEVTWAEWERCVSAGGCASLMADGFGGGTRPVTNVSWNEAVAYTTWLSNKAGHTYRLLSEAEWEYAARAESSGRWSFGDNEAALGSYAWFSSNAASATQAVGMKMANAFGLYDMHGNVWEWVQDCYAKNYSDGQPSNGSAYQDGSCSSRVIRGGSWRGYPQLLRSADRVRYGPTFRDVEIGFRVARTLSSAR
jgi:formylglycine-generating enzyme required for sulfatase activity